MCYNERASLWSLSTGMISCAILYSYNPTLAVFLAWVTCMQLFDYIFWANLSANIINFITTKIAMIFNVLQPVILALCIIYISKKELKEESKIILILYVIAMTLYVLYWWGDINYTLVTNDSTPSLSWEWNHKKGDKIVYGLYLILLIILFYQHFSAPLNIILVVTCIASYIFTLPYAKNSSHGRFWCFYAGFIPLGFVLMYMFYYKKNMSL